MKLVASVSIVNDKGNTVRSFSMEAPAGPSHSDGVYGVSGICYHAIVKFLEEIFDQYEIDLKDTGKPKRPPDSGETIVPARPIEHFYRDIGGT